MGKGPMKTGILVVLMATSGIAFAQTSTTNLTSDASLQTQTSTAVMPADAATSTRKWGINAFVQSYTDVKDQQLKGSKAFVGADNYMGVNYKLTSTTKLEVGYNFSVSNVTKDENANAAYFTNTYMGRSPEVTLKQTYGKIGSSDPVTAWYSYYIPMGYADQTVKGGNGTLRNDVFTTWNVRKFSFMPWLSTRAYMGNSADKVNDTLYRINWGGSIAYNFTDVFNVYYWPQTDIRTTGLNRGRATFNGAGEQNQFQHEIGVNYIAKISGAEIDINPAFVNHTDLSNGQGLGRNYYTDNTGTVVDTAEVDLNIYATF